MKNIVIKYLYDQYKMSLSYIEKRFEQAKKEGDLETYNYYLGQYVALNSVLIDLRNRGLVKEKD